MHTSTKHITIHVRIHSTVQVIRARIFLVLSVLEVTQRVQPTCIIKTVLVPVAELTLVSDRVNAVPPGGVIAMLVVASMSTWVNGRGGKQTQQPRDGTERDGVERETGRERVGTESQDRESRQRVETERQANINECLTESRNRESEQR